ncbi:MAG TPA: hydroxymethylbilane synthase [Actinomycetota bacterium]
MPRSVLRVGTRGSALALAQAEWIRQAISKVITHRNFELVPVVTAGDTHLGPLPAVQGGGKSLFTRDIQEALALGKIDLAVHSAKDLPTTTPNGILLAAIPKREDPRDALITRSGQGLRSLAPGARIGTSSMRRGMQLRALARGLDPVPMRGNVDTRLRKLTDGEVNAIVVAMAGLKRLGRAERVSELLPINVMLPAPGQGALAVECRANDRNMRAALEQLDDPDSRRAFEAERTLMLTLGGDCGVPLGALAEADGERLRMRALVGTADGKRMIADQLEGDDPEKLGIALGERLRELGADEIIAAANA